MGSRRQFHFDRFALGIQWESAPWPPRVLHFLSVAFSAGWHWHLADAPAGRRPRRRRLPLARRTVPPNHTFPSSRQTGHGTILRQFVWFAARAKAKHCSPGVVRVAVPTARAAAKLKISGATWAVRLIDVSTGGFTVLADDPSNACGPGDVGELLSPEGEFSRPRGRRGRSGAGWTTAAAERSARCGWGWERLDEIPAKNVRPWRPRCGGHSAAGDGLFPLGPQRPLRRGGAGHRPAAAPLGHRRADAESPFLPPIVLLGQECRQFWGGGQNRPATRPTIRRPTRRTSRPNSVAGRLARSLPGPEPFAAPEVAAALQLSDAQQAKFHELIEATIGALRSVDEKWQKESRQSQARKRNASSRRRRTRP